MTELVQCERKGKWIRGCRFEGRYDRGAPRALTEDELFWFDVNDRLPALSAMAPVTYVRDVCLTCGRSSDRVPSPAPTGEETR